MGNGKHTFNTLLYAGLFLYSMISFITGLIKIINPQQIPEGAMTSSVGLSMIIAVIIIHGILPLIFAVALIFHVVAFFKSDLNAKPFNTEYVINLILVIIALISGIILWSTYIINPYTEIGMAFAPIAIAWVIALIVSFVIFFNGFINYKKNK